MDGSNISHKNIKIRILKIEFIIYFIKSCKFVENKNHLCHVTPLVYQYVGRSIG